MVKDWVRRWVEGTACVVGKPPELEFVKRGTIIAKRLLKEV